MQRKPNREDRPFSSQFGKSADFVLTSQARTANEWTSPAIVALGSTDPRRRGTIKSGAAPWNDRSTSTPGMVCGMDTVPKPAMRT